MFDDRITLAAEIGGTNKLNKLVMERYRSGHNEAVLKTVCPQGRVGSNPTLSVSKSKDLRSTKKVEKSLDNFKMK